MKLHNFDPFGLGYNDIGSSGGGILNGRGGSPMNNPLATQNQFYVNSMGTQLMNG